MVCGFLLLAGRNESGGNLDNAGFNLLRIEIIQSGGLDDEWLEELEAQREGVHGGNQKLIRTRFSLLAV